MPVPANHMQYRVTSNKSTLDRLFNTNWVTLNQREGGDPIMTTHDSVAKSLTNPGTPCNFRQYLLQNKQGWQLSVISMEMASNI